ncbi:Helix-turn-helix domain protein [Actibacterium lipolyticum]|uniref:Helix-turn-helix domain protein n=1 Tax=Actibacterium lipolyticum TaxID=1524263 RepID=A0A238JQ02_9RHOB|nr:Helix-turn-helix domain protein [Actibacterium lipolyticum]
MSLHHRSNKGMIPKLSVRDLEEIREIIESCLDKLTETVDSECREATPEYLTTPEVAALTKYKKATLEAMRSKRQGPPYYRQGYNVRYRSDEVRAWMEANREDGDMIAS